MICNECEHEHQSLLCGHVLKWTSNNIPEKICMCKKFVSQDNDGGGG